MKSRRLTCDQRALFAMQSQSKRGFTLIDLMVIVAIVTLIAAVIIPMLARSRENARKSSCLNNFKQLSIGFHLYTQDYNRFPPAKIGGVRPSTPSVAWSLNPPVGWVDSLYPYTKSSTLNYCPTSIVLAGGDPTMPNATHIFYNGNLSAFPSTELTRPAATLLTGDGNDGREVADGTYNKTSLPAQWLNDYNSPAYRHLGGANYGFADGHVKWLRPDEISSAPGADYTFSTQ